MADGATPAIFLHDKATLTYTFDVLRPGKKYRFEIQNAEIELSPELSRRETPFQVGFGSIQLSNREGVSKGCEGWFP